MKNKEGVSWIETNLGFLVTSNNVFKQKLILTEIVGQPNHEGQALFASFQWPKYLLQTLIGKQENGENEWGRYSSIIPPV